APTATQPWLVPGPGWPAAARPTHGPPRAQAERAHPIAAAASGPPISAAPPSPPGPAGSSKPTTAFIPPPAAAADCGPPPSPRMARPGKAGVLQGCARVAMMPAAAPQNLL